MGRCWALLPLVVVLLLAGCSSGPAQCRAADVDTISWIQEGYADSLWPRVQVPPPGTTGMRHDPGLGPDSYILDWGDRGGPWDVPLESHPVDEWSYVPRATYRSLDGNWSLEFSENATTVELSSRRDPVQDGSLVQEMRLVAGSVSVLTRDQEARLIDGAIRNASRNDYVMEVPGPPRIGHLWNERQLAWGLTAEPQVYRLTAGPWSFDVDLNSIHVDRKRGPDHTVDLWDRVYADPAELDPDNFVRLREEPSTIDDAIGWFRLLAIMPPGEPQDVLVEAPADCGLPAGVGRLPQGEATLPVTPPLEASA